MSAAVSELLIEPLVRWPRQMTPGASHLIEVDLRLAGGDWPYEDEEFAFTFLVDGGSGITVDALGDSTVMLHRFGGTYGPARFVAVADERPGEHSLWLSMLTQQGVLARTDRLPVTVHGTAPEVAEAGTALPEFARRAFAAAARRDPRGQHYLTVQLEPGGFRSGQYLMTVWYQRQGEYPIVVLTDDWARPIDEVPDRLQSALESVYERVQEADLNLEFILPNHMLGYPVDEWVVNYSSLGLEYPVVVRSLERMRSGQYLGARRKWQGSWRRLQQPTRDINQIALAGFDEDARSLAMRDDEPGCLFLKFTPDPEPRERAGQRNLYDLIVSSGISAMLWPRDDNVSKIEALYSLIRNADINMLPVLVHQFRIESPVRNGRAALSLLWDDPGRLPGELPRLEAPR